MQTLLPSAKQFDAASIYQNFCSSLSSKGTAEALLLDPQDADTTGPNVIRLPSGRFHVSSTNTVHPRLDFKLGGACSQPVAPSVLPPAAPGWAMQRIRVQPQRPPATGQCPLPQAQPLACAQCCPPQLCCASSCHLCERDLPHFCSCIRMHVPVGHIFSDMGRCCRSKSGHCKEYTGLISQGSSMQCHFRISKGKWL